ncbi:RNA-binding protein (RRM domain) [Pyrenophora tritici-repentis]|nr:RBD protein [Pyrenophora tritici-repentis]PZC93792.1 RNA-binding protein (RRM domain) [Pyrenophora tritici-repentis]PZD27595.1 RNA-binding protein (RRM domain) [Pyrenophora tritici-repentis]
MADENYEDDIFDDLWVPNSEPTGRATQLTDLNSYDDEPASKSAAATPPIKTEPEPAAAEPTNAPPQDSTQNNGEDAAPSWPAQDAPNQDTQMEQSNFNTGAVQSYENAPMEDDNYGPINVKEDGKMFIGGLNWETTEESLKNYFSQFGEVSECTVMRDSATGRSRGFGFLTFKDPKCVNIVMVKEHYLDGKIIDPKRAIPREEQERTSKIFVGGVSQEATEEDFTNFFKQFGRVVDATLMMDKETGRPRGFGFVTFDGDAAVDATLREPLQILGKQIEVKRAQPRGNMRDEEGGDGGKKFGRNNKFNKFNDGGNGNHGGGGYDNSGGNMQAQGGNSAMSPAMMAQYWQRMQQYFQSMQQTLAQQQAGGGMAGNPMAAMGGMNPMQMQQMQQQMMGQGMNRGTGSPNPQMMGGPGSMNPMQMQQMQQMQMAQMQGGGGPGGPGGPGMMSPQGGQNPGQRPAYNPQDQLAFEQQKYEQQQARRQQQLSGPAGYANAQGGPQSWDGMYDDAPPPPSGPGGPGRGGFRNNRSRQGSSQPPAGGGQAPINAPTGPKNAGVRGANYRGGGHRGGGGFRHQPYGGRGG